MKKILIPLLLHMIIFCSSVDADETKYQLVYVNSNVTHVKSFDTVNVEIWYKVSDDNLLLRGVGFKVLFNSNDLEYIDISFYFSRGANGTPGLLDSCNTNDLVTDSCVTMGWISISPYWPGSDQQLPLKLAVINFKVKETSNYKKTNIRIEEMSKSSGYEFKWIGKVLSINNPLPSDINENGRVELEDVLLIMRKNADLLQLQ